MSQSLVQFCVAKTEPNKSQRIQSVSQAELKVEHAPKTPKPRSTVIIIYSVSFHRRFSGAVDHHEHVLLVLDVDSELAAAASGLGNCAKVAVVETLEVLELAHLGFLAAQAGLWATLG